MVDFNEKLDIRRFVWIKYFSGGSCPQTLPIITSIGEEHTTNEVVGYETRQLLYCIGILIFGSTRLDKVNGLGTTLPILWRKA
jgi:hypothetical protein